MKVLICCSLFTLFLVTANAARAGSNAGEAYTIDKTDRPYLEATSGSVPSIRNDQAIKVKLCKAILPLLNASVSVKLCASSFAFGAYNSDNIDNESISADGLEYTIDDTNGTMCRVHIQHEGIVNMISGIRAVSVTCNPNY